MRSVRLVHYEQSPVTVCGVRYRADIARHALVRRRSDYDGGVIFGGAFFRNFPGANTAAQARIRVYGRHNEIGVQAENVYGVEDGAVAIARDENLVTSFCGGVNRGEHRTGSSVDGKEGTVGTEKSGGPHQNTFDDTLRGVQVVETVRFGDIERRAQFSEAWESRKVAFVSGHMHGDDCFAGKFFQFRKKGILVHRLSVSVHGPVREDGAGARRFSLRLYNKSCEISTKARNLRQSCRRGGRLTNRRRVGIVLKTTEVKMKSYRKELYFNLPTRRGFVNITPQVEQALAESGVREGLVLVNAMNITASVFINDDESGLHSDFEKWLERLAPEKPYSQYAHNGYEDNADAHLKRTVMGREVVVAITNGRLDFGTWEQIFYGEFDGKRTKRVLVKIIGE